MLILIKKSYTENFQIKPRSNFSPRADKLVSDKGLL